MRFLADENCDFSIIRALRGADFEILSAAEITPRATDVAVMDFTHRGKRILLTEDMSFARLSYAHAHGNQGVILLRYPAKACKEISRDIVELAKKHGKKLIGNFVVVEPDRVRISRNPL